MNNTRNKKPKRYPPTIHAYFNEDSHVLTLDFFNKVLHRKNLKIITIFKDGKEINKESYSRIYTLEYEKSESLQLYPIMPDQFFKIRATTNDAGFILKQGDVLYYTKLDTNKFVDFRYVLLNRQHHLCKI